MPDWPMLSSDLAKLLLAGAAIALMAILAGCQHPKPGGLSPGRLSCASPRFNFGRVSQSESASLTHVFIVRNIGASALEVARVRTSCGCTTATFSPRVLPPGGEMPVKVAANWTGRAGPISTCALVYASGPPRPPLVLTVSGFVLSPLSAIQPRLNFGWLAPGQRRARVLTICGGTASKGSVLVYRVAGLPPNATATPVPGQAFGVPGAAKRMRSEDIRVAFTGMPNRNLQTGWMRVWVAGMGSLRVRFAARSYGTIMPYPQQLLIVRNGRHRAVGQLRIATWTGGRLRVKVIRSKSGPALSAKLTAGPVHVGRRWWWSVLVRVAHGASGDGLAGYVSATSGKADVEVPVLVLEE